MQVQDTFEILRISLVHKCSVKVIQHSHKNLSGFSGRQKHLLKSMLVAMHGVKQLTRFLRRHHSAGLEWIEELPRVPHFAHQEMSWHTDSKEIESAPSTDLDSENRQRNRNAPSAIKHLIQQTVRGTRVLQLVTLKPLRSKQSPTELSTREPGDVLAHLKAVLGR